MGSNPQLYHLHPARLQISSDTLQDTQNTVRQKSRAGEGEKKTAR